MEFDFLAPLDTDLLIDIKRLSSQHLSSKVVFHTEHDFPEIEKMDIAIIGVLENRGNKNSNEPDLLEVRKQYNKVLKEKGHEERKDYSFSLLIDGNYFKPITYFDKKTNKIETIPHVTIEGGDNKYASIAAASILAKVERDKYIDELCEQNPTLSEYYGIDSNKGYGAKRHMDGIKEHGITIWHRRSFAPCKNYI